MIKTFTPITVKLCLAEMYISGKENFKIAAITIAFKTFNKLSPKYAECRQAVSICHFSHFVLEALHLTGECNLILQNRTQ